MVASAAVAEENTARRREREENEAFWATKLCSQNSTHNTYRYEPPLPAHNLFDRKYAQPDDGLVEELRTFKVPRTHPIGSREYRQAFLRCLKKMSDSVTQAQRKQKEALVAAAPHARVHERVTHEQRQHALAQRHAEATRLRARSSVPTPTPSAAPAAAAAHAPSDEGGVCAVPEALDGDFEDFGDTVHLRPSSAATLSSPCTRQRNAPLTPAT